MLRCLLLLLRTQRLPPHPDARSFAPEDALRQFMAGPGGAGFGGASADAMVAEVADQESWKVGNAG